MRRLWIGVLAVTATALLAGCGSGASGASSQPDPATDVATSATPAAAAIPGFRVGPGQFVSLELAPAGQRTQLEVALSDVSTGAIVRSLLPATTSTGLDASGLALDRAGDLWITYSKGPQYRGNVAGGDPRPGSCANEIDEVHAGTGHVTVFLRTGDNVLISDARPSPDGTRLLYTESACTAYLDGYLRVTDLRSERSWTIGHNEQGCHILESPAWSASGAALIAAYGPASEPSAPAQPGVCPAPWAGRLLYLNAGAAQPGLTGTTVRADQGCEITSAAALAGGGTLAVEACGTAPEYTDGPAELLVLNAAARPVRRIPLGNCTDGNELAPSQAGTSALVSAYLYCAPSGNPGPVTKLWEYHDGQLRQITSVRGETGGALTMLALPG